MKEEEIQSEMYDPCREGMPLEERKAYFDRKANEIVEYAYKNAPAVRERFDKAGIDVSQIRTVKDLETIPVLSKSELRGWQKANLPFGGFLATSINEVKRIFVSPGPLYDALGSAEDMQLFKKAFHAAGFRKGDIVLNSFSYHLVPAGLLFDDCLREIGAIVIPAGIGNSELQAQIMYELGVTAYGGTPSFLTTLIKRAEASGYDFRCDFKVRHALVGGEMLPPSLRKEFEDYGIDVRQVYGSADLGIAAYECYVKHGMHFPEEMIVEVVDPATGKQLPPGEVGEVVVTPLSRIYPLIRFGTGDLSYYNDEPCPCGRTSPRLMAIVGRTGDSVKVKGMFLVPAQLKEAVSKFPEVSKFQAVVVRKEHKDVVNLRVELKGEAGSEKLSELIQDSIRESCRLKMDKIEFVVEGTIPEKYKLISDERIWE